MANPKPNTSGLCKGRKGRPNKNLSIQKVREQYLEAFDRLGGVNRLVEYAGKSDKHYGQLLGLVAAMLPKAVEGTIDTKVTHDLSTRLLAARQKAAELYNSQTALPEPQNYITITNQGIITETTGPDLTDDPKDHN